MSRQLKVIAFATTADDFDDVGTSNSLIITEDPDGSKGRAYWQGRRVTNIEVRSTDHRFLSAVVIFKGKKHEIGLPQRPFTYEGKQLSKPQFDGHLNSAWTVTFFENEDCIAV